MVVARIVGIVSRTRPRTDASSRPRAGPGGPPHVRHQTLLLDGNGIPVGTVLAAANRYDSPLLRPTLERLGRFDFRLPPVITEHLRAGYDAAKTRGLLDEFGFEAEVATMGKLAICTGRRIGASDAFVALANEIITVRRLIRDAWTTTRWDTRPERRPELSPEPLRRYWRTSISGWFSVTHSAIRRFRAAMNSSVASRYVTYSSFVAGIPERLKLSKGR